MHKHHITSALRTLAIVLAVAATASCRRQLAYHTYRPTPTEGWEQGDTLHFHIDTLRHAGRYAMSIGVRTSASTPYPFQSLFLVVREHWHAPERITCDTIECRLTDSEGDLTGTGVSIYQAEQPLHTLELGDSASADISITHIMRRELLPGITDVGLKLERAD